MPNLKDLTKLTGNFRLLIVEERFDKDTGERYLVDDQGLISLTVVPNAEPKMAD